MTAKTVVMDWIEKLWNSDIHEFTTHEFENGIGAYGLMIYGIVHTPSTYARRFRELRELSDGFGLQKFKINDVSKRYPQRGDATWEIVKQTASQPSTSKLPTAPLGIEDRPLGLTNSPDITSKP